MKLLSKLIFILFISLSLLTVILFTLPESSSAQTPGLNFPCAETSDDEFNSLRPYQAAPCGDAPKARFCSNRLTFFESFDMKYRGNCDPKNRTGNFPCNPNENGEGHIDKHNLYIELDDSYFPILGNTEDALDDAQKVNEYASWYLSGVNDKLENKDATDEQIVNFSGPVKKLIPAMIQDSQRIKTIESATNKVTVFDEDLGREVLDSENHDQKVVDNLRLSSWSDGSLSFLNTFFNWIGTDIWNKKYPPLPWQFSSQTSYQKAYSEWQGKNCAILPIVGLQCLDNPLVSNKYADLWHYVPLSNNSDKKGANYLLTIDGPNYVPSRGTEIANDRHESYQNAPLFFAHVQEVMDLSKLLNQTFRPAGYESEPLPETTDEIKRGINTAVGTSAHTNNAAYEGLDCSNLVVRTNKGDNLFPGDDHELTVTGVEYDITEAQCEEKYEPGTPTGCGPGDLLPCRPKREFKCLAEVAIELNLGTKTPGADEIFADTVADSGSTFRKIFPKVEEGAPVSCIADIPTVTTVTYDATKSDSPKGGESTFRVKNIPFDGGSGETELTFPHIGSVYEYFLKGIQTALRPQGYGEPIVDGQLCKNSVKCGELPELPKATGSCNLGGISSRVGDIPQSLKDIVSAAAETYKVPPNLILAIMYGEGLFDGGNKKDWTDENVKSWATCKPVPNCNDGAGDDGFMGFFDGTWDNIAEEIKPDLLALDPARTQKPSRCNLLDAVYGLAWNLHDSSFRGAGFGCFGYTDLGANTPNSCSWNDPRQYLSAIKIAENGYEQGCFTKENSCATGGGNDALCDNGIDGCETINNRYKPPQGPSHMACLWDVAHGD